MAHPEENGGSVWPEQEAVDSWWDSHSDQLKAAVTKERVAQQKRADRLSKSLTEETKKYLYLMSAITAETLRARDILRDVGMKNVGSDGLDVALAKLEAYVQGTYEEKDWKPGGKFIVVPDPVLQALVPVEINCDADR